MAIRDWPKLERPREKLLAHGAEQLSDAELVAIFLRTGIKGETALDVARRLLAHFGGLRPLLSCEPRLLRRHRGIGDTTIVLLKAALELGHRHWAATLQRGDALLNPDHTRRYLTSRLRDRPHEVFACLYLDARHRVIQFVELFRGTIDGANVYPREVVKQALALNASAVILAHNHPSGVCDPSQADRLITERLREALALVDVRVLDHFIVGDGNAFSFAEHGLL